ncbi:hypothetical protein [Rheinheimera texasensis]|uniref:hypothetical protein n=1 Tax=Rheinheimera texasensis TaxID=306205 RepID=UPI0004E1FB95|nr:hypothetical protein [Rheinheimera texasensis]
MQCWRILLIGIGLLACSPKLWAQEVTIATEFSDSNAKAYSTQMQHWQLLLQSAPQLQVKYVHVAMQRGFELLTQSGYCTINKLKTTERAARWLYSARPLNVSPSLRLITLGQSEPGTVTGEVQAAQDEVDLQNWLRHPARRKIGITAGSSYGATIDQLIKSRPNQFYLVHGQDVTLKLWQMLKRGRIDAIMDYPVRIDHLRQVQQDNTTYTALPLQGLPLYLEGFVVCNREAHGQQLMQYIDELMAQPQVQQRLVASYRQYFTDAQWQQLQPYLQQTFSAAF